VNREIGDRVKKERWGDGVMGRHMNRRQKAERQKKKTVGWALPTGPIPEDQRSEDRGEK
jgi:hypothetical protein